MTAEITVASHANNFIMHSTPRSPILQLPPCLLVEIFDFLHPKEPFQPRDLSAFCRTCKVVNQLGTPWLYRHFQWTDMCDFRHFKSFYHSLKHRHNLRVYPESLELSTPEAYRPHTRDDDIISPSLVEDLRRRGLIDLKRTCTFSLILAAWFDMAYGLILSNTPRLKILSLHYYKEARVMELNMRANVKREVLLHLHPDQRLLQLEEVTFTQSLDVRGGSFNDSYLFFEWMSCMAPSLKRLTFSVGTWDPKGALPQRKLSFQSLTHLNLGRSHIPPGPLKLVLSSCNALKSFHFTPVDGDIDDPDDIWKDGILPTQPNDVLEALRPQEKTLESLRIAMVGAKIPHGPKSIREGMVSMSAFERLTHLTLDTCCYHSTDPLSELLPPNLESFQLIGMHRTIHEELQDLADSMSRLQLPRLQNVTLYPWPCAALSCTDITKLSRITDSFRRKGVVFSCSSIHGHLQIGELDEWIEPQIGLDEWFDCWDDFWNDRGWSHGSDDD